ncbi:hypothetical protein [Vibrio sp. WXL210]|uniref:hypothetical protein n=1 Tax=Vibrio sp. WXL210 TaxID=3450709 RepID=UPI003EC8EDD4
MCDANSANLNEQMKALHEAVKESNNRAEKYLEEIHQVDVTPHPTYVFVLAAMVPTVISCLALYFALK